MLRAAADALAERLLDALPPTRAYTRADLAGPGLPRPIGHFLLQSLERRLELEADTMRGQRSGWFAYDAPDVQAAEQAYWRAVGHSAQIPAAEWEKALVQTVHQVVPYLVAPAQTLVHFVYSDGRDTLPLDVIERRMRYFLPYPYLRDVVAAYAQQKALDAIARDDFSRLLTRIEARTGAAYDADGLVALAADLFATLGEGPEPRIARDHALRFLADKGMPDAVDRLRAAPERLTAADLRAALLGTPRGLMPDDEPPAAPAPVPLVPLAPPIAAAPVAPVPAAPVAIPPAPAAPVAVPPAPATPADVAPRWAQVQAADVPSRLDTFAPAEATPLWKRLIRGGDADLDAEGVRLEALVLGASAAAHRKRFVRDLFGGDARAYADALARLAPLLTWAEAARAIASIFRAQQVDLYADAAVAFTDHAEQRYL